MQQHSQPTSDLDIWMLLNLRLVEYCISPSKEPLDRDRLSELRISEIVDKHCIRPTAMQTVGDMMGQMESRDRACSQICGI